MLLKDTVGIYGSTTTGGTPVTTEERITEDGEQRITEDGEIREIESITPAGFTPTDIANCAWFSDPLTSPLTFSSGSIVQQMDDESGNGRDFSEGTVAKQPVLNVAGGLTELTFDGVDDSLSWTGPQITVTGGWTFFFACRHITRISTGQTWFAATPGTGEDQNTGWRGRGEGLIPNPAWALRMFFDNVLGTQVNISLQHGTDLDVPHWAIFKSDGGTPNRVISIENDIGGSVNTVTTADPAPLTNVVIGERLNGTVLAGQNANVGFYAGGIYQQNVTGQDLVDLKSWLNDRITP